MADDDYSKPAKGETAAQAADRRAKFYSKQRQDAEDAANSKGDEKTKRGGAATAAKVYGKLAEGQRKKLGLGILNPWSEQSAEARGTEEKGQEYDAQARFGDWGRNIQSAADGTVEVATNIAPYIAGGRVAGAIGKGVANKVAGSRVGQAVAGSRAGKAVAGAASKVKSAKDAVTSAPGRATKAVVNKVKTAFSRGTKTAEAPAPKPKASYKTAGRTDVGSKSKPEIALRSQKGTSVGRKPTAKPAESEAKPSGSGRRVKGASDTGTRMASGVRKTGVRYDAENATYRGRPSATTADARAELSGKNPPGSGVQARSDAVNEVAKKAQSGTDKPVKANAPADSNGNNVVIKDRAGNVRKGRTTQTSEAPAAKPAEAPKTKAPKTEDAKPAASGERTAEQKAAYEKYKSLGRTKKGTPENEERKAAWRAMHKDDQRDYNASKPPRAAAGDTTATKPKGEEAPKKGRPKGRKTGVPSGGVEAAEKKAAAPKSKAPKRRGFAISMRTDSPKEAAAFKNAARPESRLGQKVTKKTADMAQTNGIAPYRSGIATTKAASKSAAEKGVKNKVLKELHKRKVIKHVKVKKSDA